MEKLVRFKTNDEIKTGKVLGNKVISDETEKNLAEVDILPPVEPSKIICVGLNCREHAEE